jgi:hypothetical protein
MSTSTTGVIGYNKVRNTRSIQQIIISGGGEVAGEPRYRNPDNTESKYNVPSHISVEKKIKKNKTTTTLKCRIFHLFQQFEGLQGKILQFCWMLPMLSSALFLFKVTLIY